MFSSILSFFYVQFLKQFIERSISFCIRIVGEFFAFLDGFEEFFGRRSCNGKRQAVVQNGLLQENRKRLGERQAQVVE